MATQVAIDCWSGNALARLLGLAGVQLMQVALIGWLHPHFWRRGRLPGFQLRSHMQSPISTHNDGSLETAQAEARDRGDARGWKSNQELET
jgi:hypothetical protein